MLPSHISFDSVLATTRRIPYTNSDGEALVGYVKRCHKHGLDIHLHRMMSGTHEQCFKEGIIALTSLALDSDFVFVKVDGGRGLLGGQKANFASYIGQLEQDQLLVGTTFRSFLVALTSINNIYRSEGLLRGPAI